MCKRVRPASSSIIDEKQDKEEDSMKKLFVIVLLAIKRFHDPYYQGVPAQLSFYYTLSIVPILILITQILGIVFGKDIESSISWILERADITLVDSLMNIVSFKTAYVANIFFIALLIWAASKAQFSMMRITNFTFSDGKTTGKGYFRDRLKAILVMGFTLVTVIFGILVLGYGNQILNLVLSLIGLEEEGAKIWLIVRWPIALALYFFMVLLNYYILPSERMNIRTHLPGAVFASLGLLFVTFIYSEYIGLTANYNIIYGSLASVVALILWFFFLGSVLSFGIIFNKAWQEYHSTKK